MYAVTIASDTMAIISEVRAFTLESEYRENNERSMAVSPTAPEAETMPIVAVQLNASASGRQNGTATYVIGSAVAANASERRLTGIARRSPSFTSRDSPATESLLWYVFRILVR